MTKVTIKLDMDGQGKILIGKKDISSIVTGLNLDYSAGSAPTLSLNIVAEDVEIISDMRNQGISVEGVKLVNY